jgi:hypothetical protein
VISVTVTGSTSQLERAREVLILRNSIGKCYLRVLLASLLILRKLKNLIRTPCSLCVCMFIPLSLLGNGSINMFPRQRNTSDNRRIVARRGGGVEYLHRDRASRRRRRKEKSNVRDSKIWSRVPRDSDPRRITLWWGPTAYSKDRPVLSLERTPHKNKTVTVKQ